MRCNRKTFLLLCSWRQHLSEALLACPGGERLPPAVGLTARGSVLAGALTLAEGATSLAVRADGPGGAYLLFTTRDSQLHARAFAALTAAPAPAAEDRQTSSSRKVARKGCASQYTRGLFEVRQSSRWGRKQCALRASTRSGMRGVIAKERGRHRQC